MKIIITYNNILNNPLREKKLYRNNGILKEQYSFNKDNEFEGIYKKYYSCGQLHLMCLYKKDKIFGISLKY